MTCVPDGIIQSLNSDDFIKINLSKNINAVTFMEKIKEHNRLTSHVKVQNKALTEQEMNENMERIKEINTANLNNGYLCSSHEPLLILICELFEVDIKMNFNGSTVLYQNSNKTRKVINYMCSRSHFMYVDKNKHTVEKQDVQNDTEEYVSPGISKWWFIFILLIGIILIIFLSYLNKLRIQQK